MLQQFEMKLRIDTFLKLGDKDQTNDLENKCDNRRSLDVENKGVTRPFCSYAQT